MEFLPIGDSELAEISQLNRIFLALLRDRDSRGRTIPGLSKRLSSRLNVQGDEALDSLASLPRCLFELRLTGRTDAPVLPQDDWEAARRSFAIVALCAAWKASRRSSPACRTLFGLQRPNIRSLRTMGLQQVLMEARQEESLGCAMGGVPGYWDRLLEEATQRTRLSRRSVLVAIASSNRWPRPAMPARLATLQHGL